MRRGLRLPSGNNLSFLVFESYCLTYPHYVSNVTDMNFHYVYDLKGSSINFSPNRRRKLMSKIVAFDIETPNRKNDRICSLGLTVIENGEITNTFYSLVNPECEFDSFNISIHGISPEDAAVAPTFKRVWEEVGYLFRENLVAAHNATFDLCVLRKVLAHYNIGETIINYVCTMKLSKAMNAGVHDYKLSTLCDYFGIHLNHHNAASDSEACATILCNYMKMGVDTRQHTNSYNLSYENNSGSSAFHKISANTQVLLQLDGILEGITCDNILAEDEVIYLSNWMNANSSLRGNYPYDNIFNILTTALADGVLEKRELDEMLLLFKRLSDPVNDCGCNHSITSLEGKCICLSGEFDRGSKSDISEELISRGATIHNTVTQKTDYLVVGGQGSSAWCAGNYGTKVKKALEFQSKGIGIIVIRETDFFSSLEALTAG